MPGSERLFNQAEGRTKWYVCKLKPDAGRWDALLNVRMRDSWNRPRKVGVFNSSLPPLLETTSEPNLAYWNYCKEMNCWAGCWPGACTSTATCQVGPLGHFIWGRPWETCSSQAEHLGSQSGRLQVFTCAQSGKWDSLLLKTSGGWQNFWAKFRLF